MTEPATIMDNIKDIASAAIFLLISASLIWYIIRLHMANGEFKHFRISQLFMRADGTLDRKGLRDTILFITTIYGFIEVVRHHETLIIQYFMTMLGAWGIYHVADNKLPTMSMAAKQPEPHD